MHGHAAKDDGRMLRRIIALLVSFADLAERAAGRSAPVRCFVLWILRWAEMVAEEFVFDAAGVPQPALEGTASAGNGPDDALRLAARFYALAAALCALLPLEGLFGRRHGRRGLAFGPVAQDCSRFSGGLKLKLNDTS